MSTPSFPNPTAAIGISDFSSAANDEAAGFDINPLTAASPSLGGVDGDVMGPGGFSRPGAAAQNIVTDVNVGLSTPSGMVFGPAPLTNPMQSSNGMPMAPGLGNC